MDTQPTQQQQQTLSKAQKMQIYRANLKLNDPEKYKLINDNKALANKTKYHTDPHYKAQQNQKSKDKYTTTKFILDNMDQLQKTQLLHKLRTTQDNSLTTQPTKDNTQTTKDNTQPAKDNTQPVKDTTQTTKDNTQPNNSKNKLSDIITYNDNNTFTCSICNLTIFNKFYNKHINSKKHINNIKK